MDHALIYIRGEGVKRHRASNPNHRRCCDLSGAARIKAETSNLFPERRTEMLIVAAGRGGGGGDAEAKKSTVNSPMWMIESESADFHSWLQKTAASNKAQITFMLSRDI